MNTSAHEFLKFLACCFRNRLDGFTTIAQHDTFVTVAHHINNLINAGRTVFMLLPVLSLDCHLIGQLLVQPQGQFLACHFGSNHPQRQIGNLVFRIEPWPLGQTPGQPAA